MEVNCSGGGSDWLSVWSIDASLVRIIRSSYICSLMRFEEDSLGNLRSPQKKSLVLKESYPLFNWSEPTAKCWLFSPIDKQHEPIRYLQSSFIYCANFAVTTLHNKREAEKGKLKMLHCPTPNCQTALGKAPLHDLWNNTIARHITVVDWLVLH